MSSTLTERYIAATIKSLPSTAQDDVRAELAASIGDAIEARVEQGEDREAAERAVLTELGDPGVLAAGYADRPLHLIGPRYYLTWWRLLKLLWIIVPTCAFGGMLLAQALANAPIGEIIGSAIGVGVSSVAHVAFWVTLVFVILERTGADTGVRWDVDRLREPQETGTGRVDLIVSLVFLALAAGAIVADRFLGLVWLDGAPSPILNPELWPWSITGLLVLLAGEAVLAIAVYVAGRWNITLAFLNTALAVLFVSLTVTLLARGELVNPEFLDLAFTANGVDGEVLRILAVVTGFAIVGLAVWDVVDGWMKTARAARR